MNLGVFLQARIGSTRLRRKALLPLEGKTVLLHCMEALSMIPGKVHALLTDQESESWFSPLAQRAGFEVYIGDPHNVLNRYISAARYFNVDTICRATGDNPLVSPHLAKLTIALHLSDGGDYSALEGGPLGTGVEIARLKALLPSAQDPTLQDYDREHVMPYIYHRPEKFLVQKKPVPENLFFPNTRVTLDTAEDYQHLKKIFSELYQGKPIDVDRLCPYLKERGFA